MDTDGGGWTVIQRRQDGSVPFDRTWTEYEQGFGNVIGEYWLGLGNIHSLTTQKQNELYVYLEDWEMNSRFARYSTFSVGDAGSKYTATIDGYSGDATDDLDQSTHHSINNRHFSTTDQDNDPRNDNCASKYGQGGWWYTGSCGLALLNGQYLTGCSVPAPGTSTCSSADGIVWYTWRGYRYSLKKTDMMIRPDNFPASSFRPCQNGGNLTSGPEDSGLYICACADGSYGAFCDQECGHCYLGRQTCDKFDGACPTNGPHVCAAGYNGTRCDQIPATISGDPEEITVVVGNEVTFRCTGRGVPAPTVVWHHNGDVITPGDGISINVTDRGLEGEQHVVHSTLNITSARRQDNGQYVCISSNVAGSDTSQEATLVVQERPDEVTVNVTAVNSTALHVTWAVGVTGNLDIIDSQVRYKRSDTADWGDWESAGASGVNGDVYIYGSRPAVEYNVQVRVNNSLGWSDPGNGNGTTAEAPPGPPGNLQAAPSSHSSVQLTWEPPIEPNGEIISYIVQYGASELCNETELPQEVVTTDGGTTTVIEDLDPYTNYTFRVRGVTSAGEGDFSNCTSTRTLEYYPTAPVIQTFADQHDCNCRTPNIPRPVQLHVAWRRPDHIHGQLQAYRVSLYNSTGGEPFYQENMTSGLQQENLTAVVTSSHLQPAHNYSVTVSAINTFYQGNESHPYVARTSDGCPDAADVTKSTNSECGVTWTAPTETRGRLTGYMVTYVDTPRHNPDESDPGVSYDTLGLNEQRWSKSLDDLPANSMVRVTVRAKTCAEGDKGEEFTCDVSRVEPPPIPVLPTGTPQNASATSFPMVLPKVSERNGPIRCCQIIVIPMNEDESLADLSTRVGEPDVMLTEDASEDGKTQPYVALSLSSEQYKSTDVVQIGEGGPCGHQWCCERSELADPRLAKTSGNKELRSGETYTAAVRCYVDSGARRRKRATEKLFTTSGYMDPVITVFKEAVRDVVTPIAAGAAVGVLLVSLVAVGFYVYRRRAAGKKDAPADVSLADLSRLRHKDEDENEEEPQGAVGPGVDHVEEVIVKPTKRRSGKKPKSPNFQEPVPLPDLEAEFDKRNANDNQKFAEEYSALPGTLGKERAEAYYSDCNTTKNRFKNIVTYDSGRVKLNPIPGVAGSDYISASYMDGYKAPRKYIAAQGPLPNTVDDFWRMIWDTKAKNIVMVTNLKENNKQKCTQYWPDSGKKIYGDIDVTLADTIPMVDHVTRIFLVGKEGIPAKREVTQFHFLGWPDFGLPRSPMGLLKFRRAVITKMAPRDMPIVVHCSAGVGRTGTFITIDAMLEMMQAEEKVDVFGFVSRMRQNRSTMVQTKAQYVFIYRALLEQYLYGDTEVEVANIHRHMHKLRTEQPGADKTGFDIEFGNLTRLPVDRANMRSGNLPENISKNRVLQILPYDTSRVFLQHKAGVKGSDYINASFIDGYRDKDVYIATQGPLDRTVEDFWRMVWEWNSCSIVMLTELKEKSRTKCTLYWPETGQKTFGEVVVSAQGVDAFGDYDLRTFTVTHAKDGKPRTVQQFHFHGWPEVGIPDNAAGMIDLIGQVQKQQQQSGNGPITVHCSSGSGRTGTFCAISTVLERVKAEGICDVFQVVKALRQQRPHMVQTLDQYQFCYQAVVEYLDSFDHYANFR
ncbi:receptor-type tyrosine-protein phosphatase S-like isoform X1 [Branchiostoma lanceolatum]|uniref:receptor-type tyrosine-protein phosphatase S-like isoform X1 n=1 Tax=Branchiostoma lanceolatum TaxID=7740 RepID=UPI003451A389